MLSDRCLSCPVCDVRALWSNGWTDQDETWHAGRPRPWPHCFRWGSSSTSPKGAQPPIFGPYLLRPNGCMDQDVTWYGARPRPSCVRWGPRSPLPKRVAEHPSVFGPCLLWPNGWIDEAGTSHGGRPQPRLLCVRWGPSPLPNFWLISIVANRLDASRCHLVWR